MLDRPSCFAYAPPGIEYEPPREEVIMRIRTPGKVRDKLWFLGREESCVYLLEGDEQSMFISGGTSYVVPDLLEQFETFAIDEIRITKLLILHAHFDHIGIVPFFKRRYPDLQVYASARAWEILQMPKAIATINSSGRSTAKWHGREEAYATYDLDWRDDVSGVTVSEGDRIGLGDLEVRIYETPGHSSCSITAYVPELKAIFASDGGGIPYKQSIIAPGNSNFTMYQASLEKLKDLEVEYACADHYGYIAGDEATVFIKKSIKSAQERRSLIEESYRRTKNIDTTAKEMVDDFYRENPEYILAPEILLGVYRQLVRHIAHAMENSSLSAEASSVKDTSKSS
jgi:glyoxylase-like metal-dependent hydrolase (beta-lactamase superfamily II)